MTSRSPWARRVHCFRDSFALWRVCTADGAELFMVIAPGPGDEIARRPADCTETVARLWAQQEIARQKAQDRRTA